MLEHLVEIETFFPIHVGPSMDPRSRYEIIPFVESLNDSYLLTFFFCSPISTFAHSLSLPFFFFGEMNINLIKRLGPK